MWTALLAALAIGAAPAGDQGDQDRWRRAGEPETVPHKSIPFDRWNGRRYVGGGVTVTTMAYWVYVTDAEYPFDSTCVLACRGQKHLVHQQCDRSCDSICTSLHQLEIAPEFQYSTGQAGGRTWEGSLARGISEAGGHASQSGHVANGIRSAAMKPIQDSLNEYTYRYSSGHWNETPCSYQDRKLKYTVYSLFAAYRVVKDGQTVSWDPGSLVGTVKIPHQRFYDTSPVESCSCQIVKEQRRAIGIDGSFTPMPSSGASHSLQTWEVPSTGLRIGGLFVDEEGDGKYCAVPGGSTGQGGITAQLRLNDLNNFSITATNGTGKPVNLALMPGTTFQPADRGFQSMLNLDLLRWTVPAGSTVELPLPRSGPSPRAEAIEGFMACLDIAKKQPDGRARYTLGETTDSVLLDLGHAMAGQQLRGPWNQGQLWAYRDGASIDQINERLGLPVSTSHYLVGIFGLAAEFGVPLFGEKHRALWDPKLLLAHAATAAQLDWFVQGMARKDPRALAEWVRKGKNAFAPLFAPDAREWYIEHAAHVGASLCRAADPQVQSAGILFLEEIVPASSRAALAEQGGLEGLVELAMADGPHRAKALALVAVYDPELAEDLKTPPAEAPYPEFKPPPPQRR